MRTVEVVDGTAQAGVLAERWQVVKVAKVADDIAQAAVSAGCSQVAEVADTDELAVAFGHCSVIVIVVELQPCLEHEKPVVSRPAVVPGLKLHWEPAPEVVGYPVSIEVGPNLQQKLVAAHTLGAAEL